MPDDTKTPTTTEPVIVADTTTPTTTKDELATEPETSEANDSPYQGKRSNGGYVPT